MKSKFQLNRRTSLQDSKPSFLLSPPQLAFRSLLSPTSFSFIHLGSYASPSHPRNLGCVIQLVGFAPFCLSVVGFAPVSFLANPVEAEHVPRQVRGTLTGREEMATSVEIRELMERERDAESGNSELPMSESAPTDVPVVQQTEKDVEPVNSMFQAKISDVRHNIGESVDRLLDESHNYKAAVLAAFEQFQLPVPAKELPLSRLLPALQFFIQRLCDSLDPKAGKLVLRPITQEDVRGSMRSNSSLTLHPLLTFQQFESFARETLKRVALDRSKRLGVFLIGGIVVVHMAKDAVKNIPILGGPIGAFVNVLVPTSLLGPVVGIAGALYL